MSNPWQIQTVQYDKTNSEGNIDTTGYGQISILLSKYVLKEKGKGLSSNDFTDNDSQKLNSIEVGAEVNKLETITINNGNKIYADSDKNINIPIPIKTSDLMNDSGFAKLISASEESDYSDSYVGKSKLSFQDEESINLGKNSDVSEFGGIAIGKNTSTDENHDVNIGNLLLHNNETNMWEGKITEAEKALKNDNGTNLTELDNLIDDLDSEIQNRISADEILQNNIDSETQARSNNDDLLQSDINEEINNRISADEALQNNIDSETQARRNADNVFTQKISNIEDLIPNQATSSNQLADKSFVNSAIQTNTANFRGNWSNWTQVPTNSDSYPQDYSGSKIPTVNDYLVVQDASDYTLETLIGTWRFKYTGDWATDGKEGWIPEYQVNEEPFTSEQLYAINSGITDSKVAQYDSHLEDTNNPHNVTKSQVGLGNVVNTADSDTPIEGGTTKFTTGGAYIELGKKQSKALDNPIEIGGEEQSTVEDALNALGGEVSGKVSTAQGIANEGKILQVNDEGNLTLVDPKNDASNINYENASYPTLDNVKKALDNLISKVYYEKIVISSLSVSPSSTIYEIGNEISELQFAWVLNKSPISQTFNGTSLNDDVRSYVYDTPFSTNKSFKLVVSDGTESAEKSINIQFQSQIFFGGASKPNDYDSAFILGLSNSKFNNSTYKGSFTITASAGEYAYICCPKSWNIPSICKIVGFPTELVKENSISFTNSSGGVVVYDIVRTTHTGLGSITMIFE